MNFLKSNLRVDPYNFCHLWILPLDMYNFYVRKLIYFQLDASITLAVIFKDAT